MKHLFILFALVFFFPQSVSATSYYVDFVNGLNTNAGTATTTAFGSLNQFTENARSAGDIVFVRRGMASTTNIVAMNLTSDGTLNNPIRASADYDNLWNDFATTTQTYTFAFASSTITASAAQSDVVVGNWLYAEGDCAETYNSLTKNNCPFAYEVSAVASTSITFYLPYKGDKTGSVNVRKMPSVPQIGITTTAAQILSASTDNYWDFKGFDFRSTNSNCMFVNTSSPAMTVFDVIFQGDGLTVCVTNNPNWGIVYSKVRVFNVSNGFGSGVASLRLYDFLFDCNNAAGSTMISQGGAGGVVELIDGTIKNCATSEMGYGSSMAAGRTYMRNVKRANLNNHSGAANVNIYYEDDFSIVGLNTQSSNQIGSNTTATTTMSTTTNLRSGGGPKNMVVFPPSGVANTGISTFYFPFSYIKLFEYPIYANTTSKTYTMFFNSTSTSNFTVDPLTSTAVGSSTPELYIECEYYNTTTDANRILKRSNTANDVDFNGATTWQDIAVTCQPAQTGILYLRGWYAKPKESSVTNWFYMDTTLVVS
mgnify:FL=1